MWPILASYISEKVKRNVRKSQTQFQEKLRTLRLGQNNDVHIKKRSSEAKMLGSCYILMLGTGVEDFLEGERIFAFFH